MPPPMYGPPPMAPMMAMPKKRPGAVTGAAILSIIFGILGLLGALGLYFAFSPVAGSLQLAGLGWVPMIILVLLIFFLLQIIFGAGLLGLKKWAWMGALAITVIHLVVILVFIVGFGVVANGVAGLEAASFIVGLLTAVCALPIIIDVVVIILLVIRSSREAFT